MLVCFRMSFRNSCLFCVIVSNLLVGIIPAEFESEFQWSHINYTWASRAQYREAVSTGRYIPENIFPTGLKLYRDRLYLATPSYKGGVPFTLSYVLRDAKNKTNTPLIPFPNSILHRGKNCSYLQNVQTLEIDPKGIMWVVDGVRMSNTSKCPAKLQVFDLNKGAALIHTYVFPNDVCLQNGCYLNDIVLDDEDIFITDTSNIDPGLVVYCRDINKAFKFRDASMFPGRNGPKYSIDNHPVNIPVPIDGIALSPVSSDKGKKNRTLYYSPLTGYELFSIPIAYITSNTYYRNGLWRNYVTTVGKKQGPTDGMMMDNKGNLYYSLISLNAVGKWNIFEPFDKSEIIFQNNETLIWPDAFGMDDEGYLYVVSNHAYDFLAPEVKLTLTPDIKFRIFKYRTGNKSYQYK